MNNFDYIKIIAELCKNNIDRDFEKYHNKCEKNRANAMKKRTLATANDGSQEKEEEKEKNIYIVEQDSTVLLCTKKADR